MSPVPEIFQNVEVSCSASTRNTSGDDACQTSYRTQKNRKRSVLSPGFLEPRKTFVCSRLLSVAAPSFYNPRVDLGRFLALSDSIGGSGNTNPTMTAITMDKGNQAKTEIHQVSRSVTRTTTENIAPTHQTFCFQLYAV